MSRPQSPKHAPPFIQFCLGGRDQALGHADRLELLEHLGQGERSVEILRSGPGFPPQCIQHLQHYDALPLVASRRDGKFIIYRWLNPAVFVAVLPR